MTHVQTQSESSATGLRIGIAVSGYHHEITNALRDGAVEKFTSAGGDEKNLIIVNAPGAFELPAICQALAVQPKIDAVVALGCIIAGETTHDQYLAQAVANGLMQVALDTAVPVAFGVLTCQNFEQARARSGGEKGNKGVEAMTAVIEAVAAIRNIHAK